MVRKIIANILGVSIFVISCLIIFNAAEVPWFIVFKDDNNLTSFFENSDSVLLAIDVSLNVILTMYIHYDSKTNEKTFSYVVEKGSTTDYTSIMYDEDYNQFIKVEMYESKNTLNYIIPILFSDVKNDVCIETLRLDFRLKSQGFNAPEIIIPYITLFESSKNKNKKKKWKNKLKSKLSIKHNFSSDSTMHLYVFFKGTKKEIKELFENSVRIVFKTYLKDVGEESIKRYLILEFDKVLNDFTIKSYQKSSLIGGLINTIRK